MEKRVVLAIGLTVGLYAVYFMWFAPRQMPQQPGVRTGTGAVSTGTRAAPLEKPGDGAPVPKNGGRPAGVTYPDAPDQKISNGHLELTFAARGGALRGADAFGCLYHAPGDRSVAGDPGRGTDWVEGLPGALAVDVLGGDAHAPNLAKSNWKLTKTTASTVECEFDAGDWVVTKTTTLSADPARPWHADCTISFRNVATEPGRVRTLELMGPVQPRTIPADHTAGLLLAQGAEVEHLDAASAHGLVAESPQFERRPSAGSWAWIGARADFYLSAVIPKTALPSDASVGLRTGMRPGLHGEPPMPVAAATLRLPLVVPAQGETLNWSFTYFAGPNRGALLEDPSSPYHVLKGGKVETGFLGLKLTWIADILGWLLGKLAATGMGYGLAVISLTILVRGALFPLSRKSQISMRIHAQKMQRLKPKMDAIKEKHKDPKKQQELTMKLMREEKVSLLPGGCLLAFAQMPVWIALYSVLQSTFEMRHAGFLWVKDLTAPDQLAHMPFLAGTWFPEWFNLLPLLMMGTWYASAAMQPLPTDPQQASQAKMMRWMPVVMGFFLYSTAAGLTLYMTMSALWSIGETWVIRKLWLEKLEAALK